MMKQKGSQLLNVPNTKEGHEFITKLQMWKNQGTQFRVRRKTSNDGKPIYAIYLRSASSIHKLKENYIKTSADLFNVREALKKCVKDKALLERPVKPEDAIKVKEDKERIFNRLWKWRK